MFGCTFCSKKLESRRNLDVHVLSHTKEKPHKCLICAATFGIEGNLKQHIKSVHEGVKQIKNRSTHCPLCSFKCYSKALLEAHLRKHTTEQPFSCSVPSCGFKTKYETSLQQHFRNIHSSERPFQCPSDGCTYKTKIKHSLERHLLKIHRSLKIFTCKVPGCSFTSNVYGQLKAHNCTGEEKPWKCSVCHFRSKTKGNLAAHEDTHKKIKRFQCQARNCGYASSRKSDFDRHLDSKHRKMEEVDTLHCGFQDCRYKTKFSHRYSHHIATHSKQEKRNHVCTFCSSRFSHLCFLKSHVQRHIGEKPHRCSHCDYTCVDGASLRHHAQRVHHIIVTPLGSENTFEKKCRTCDLTFWSYSEFVLHSMTHLKPVVVMERLCVHTV